MRDQVRDDFGVGLGLELMFKFLQTLFQRQVIFDDTVVNDNDSSRLVAVRMSVLLGRTAVRRPACVADAVIPFERILLDRFF